MMKVWVLLWVFTLFFVAERPSLEGEISGRNIANDAFMKVPELISSYGYPVEEHVVQTQDGYLLTMHRIPYGIRQDSSAYRPPVFLQHGIVCSSAVWVIMGPEKGFAYILADAGYDVWMGNSRGNTYSKKHVAMSNKNKDFWDYSWHEMGKYDLPAEIDYVLEHTGEKQIFFVGHSMGTTVFYVMGSLRPEYNDKIKAHFSLAPIVFMGRIQSPFRLLSPFISTMTSAAKILGVGEFLPRSDLIARIGNTFCSDQAKTQIICSNILFVLFGFNYYQLNQTMIPVITGHIPAGASTKCFVHYAQEINSGKFRQFDYGREENLKVYGTIEPPDYDLSMITAPVYLYYSNNDMMADIKDVAELYKKLPNVLEAFLVYTNFSHVDFIWAIDVKKLLFNKIMSLMARFNNY